MLQLRREVWAGDTSLSFRLTQSDEGHRVGSTLQHSE